MYADTASSAWYQLRYRSCCFHDSSRLCVATATGDDDGENEPRGAHLAGWLGRHRRWQRKLATRARPEGTARRDNPRSTETGTTAASTSFTANGHPSTAAVATLRRRSRRSVHDLNAGSRRTRPGSDSTRILTKNDGIKRKPPAHRHGLHQSPVSDILLQVQRGGIDRKRQTMRQLLTIIRKLSDNRGNNQPPINSSGSNKHRQESPSIAYNKISMDKKASYRRRAATRASGDLTEQLRRDRLNNTPHRGRQSIDPMLLMLGIGRK